MRKIKLMAALLIGCFILPAVVFASPQAGDIVFAVGQASYWAKGTYHNMDSAPVILNGRAYMPVRYLAEALGLQIKWAPASGEIIITQPLSLYPSVPPKNIISGDIMWEKSGDITNTEMLTTVFLTGPNGTKQVNARLDTGSTMTLFPDDFLRGLGLQPVSGPISVWQAQGTMQIYYYKIPYPVIQDTPLGQGTVMVEGLPGAREALIGCDILSRDSLALHNGIWSLTIPSGGRL